MIVVKVELHSAVTGKCKLIGYMTIANDGTGTNSVGNYQGMLKAEYGDRRFKRKNFRRKTQSVWTLIGSVLAKLGHAKDASEVEVEL